MALQEQQLKKAYEMLSQGLVNLDDNLIQGVLVYIEAKAVEFGLPRRTYLSLDKLRCSFPFVSMGSFMPINFFGVQTVDLTRHRDTGFKPITLKVCKVNRDDAENFSHRWVTVGRYPEEQAEEAILMLIEVLCDEELFGQCSHCQKYRPHGYIDVELICDCCNEQLEVVA